VRHGNWRPAALLLALAILSTAVRADGYDERRVQTGLRLFRAMLAADTQLPGRAGADGALLVLFVYSDDRRRAEELADTFLKRGGVAEPVRGLPVRVEVVSASQLASWNGRPAAVFIAQHPGGALLGSIVAFGIERRLIVYSPFEGDVENGVLGGLAIEAQVRPFVNLATLEASSVTLKDFFLKVAKVHR
jgi:hypothetical protein